MFNQIIDSLIHIINDGAYINLEISNTIQQENFSPHEKKFYTKVVYGVVEKKTLIDYLLEGVSKPKRIKPFVRNSLRIGVYCISFMEVKNYFVINELVSIVKKVDYNSSKIINAILRKYIDQSVYDSQMKKLESNTIFDQHVVKSGINHNILSLLYGQYGDDIFKILETFEAPIHFFNTYRINKLKCSLQEIQEKLLEIDYELDDDIIITTNSLLESQLFKEGLIIPQDYSSIQLGKFINPPLGSSILDVCSAPGMKAIHLMQIMNNNGEILSCDIYQHKIKLIEDNVIKYNAHNIKTLIADGRVYDYGKKFDYVLVDAPCSGLGVMFHKVDLKYRINLDNIVEIIDLQYQILSNASKFVVDNGYLVYSTCTINQNENEKLIRRFLKNNINYVLVDEKSYLPNLKHDGFYMVKLKKEKIDEEHL